MLSDDLITLRTGKAAPDPGPMQRAHGAGRLALVRRGAVTVVADCYQEAAVRLRFPRPEPGRPIEAVALNTAGGLTGGDYLSLAVEAGEGTYALLTTQAAEKVYRASLGAAPARVETRLTLNAGARLDYLPQEAILFDGSLLARTLDVAMAEDARLIALEAVVLGRVARGERVARATFSDRWRLRRGGRLVYADGFGFSGDAEAILGAKATAGGARFMASLLVAAPDAEAMLDAAREETEAANTVGCEAGTSAFDGLLTCRLIAADAFVGRRALTRLLERFRGPLPRVWAI